jgi:hypothetical protein
VDLGSQVKVVANRWKVEGPGFVVLGSQVKVVDEGLQGSQGSRDGGFVTS